MKNRCIAVAIAAEFDFAALQQALSAHYRCSLYRGALHIESEEGEGFIFPYGVYVAWGLGYDEDQYLRDHLLAHASDSFAEESSDHFTFEEGAEALLIHNDHIMLQQGSVLEKLALSHGMAQSVKLSEFEARAGQTIQETSALPEEIAATGHIRLKRRELAKLRGRLFLVKSGIHLHYDLLDTPEFFWEYPDYQECYQLMSNYLEVPQRIEILNSKLNIIHELFAMLADEQKHKHSSTLEWIIIWLIAFEIAVFLGHDIFAWL